MKAHLCHLHMIIGCWLCPGSSQQTILQGWRQGKIPFQETIELTCTCIYISVRSDAYPLSLSSQATHGSQLRLYLQLLQPWTGIYTIIVIVFIVCMHCSLVPRPLPCFQCNTDSSYTWGCVFKHWVHACRLDVSMSSIVVSIFACFNYY